MPAASHVIYQQRLQLRLPAHTPVGTPLPQQAEQALLAPALLAALGQALDRALAAAGLPPDTWLTLDRATLELGSLPSAQLEATLLARLPAFLYELVAQAARRPLPALALADGPVSPLLTGAAGQPGASPGANSGPDAPAGALLGAGPDAGGKLPPEAGPRQAAALPPQTDQDYQAGAGPADSLGHEAGRSREARPGHEAGRSQEARLGHEARRSREASRPPGSNWDPGAGPGYGAGSGAETGQGRPAGRNRAAGAGPAEATGPAGWAAPDWLAQSTGFATPGALSATGPAGAAGWQPAAATLGAAWLFFLQQGTLPAYWPTPETPQRWEVELRALLRRPSPALQAALRAVLAEPTGRLRLVRQFSPALCAAVIVVLSPEAGRHRGQLRRHLGALLRPAAGGWATPAASPTAETARTPEAALLSEAARTPAAREAMGTALLARAAHPGPAPDWEAMLAALAAVAPLPAPHQPALPPAALPAAPLAAVASPPAPHLPAAPLAVLLATLAAAEPRLADLVAPGPPALTTASSSRPAFPNAPAAAGDAGPRPTPGQAEGRAEGPSAATRKLLPGPAGQLPAAPAAPPSQLPANPASRLPGANPVERVPDKARAVAATKPAGTPTEPAGSPPLTPAGELAEYVTNAGLVLLHPFLPACFEACGWLADGHFCSPEAQHQAVLLLHYLATGRSHAPEYALRLPRLLCGVPAHAPAAPRLLRLSRAARAEGRALLKAALRHWTALRSTTPAGLRSAFLQREGKLEVLAPGSYQLTVAQQAQDVLLSRLPYGWGVSLVQLPWLPAPLAVNWA